jgi:hypothetical protein
VNYPNQKDNLARQALTRAVDRALAAGAPVYVNVPAPAPQSLTNKVAHALTRLNWHYGYGDIRTVKLFMNGQIEFTVQGFGMGLKTRRGHMQGCTVHALGHQKQI